MSRKGKHSLSNFQGPGCQTSSPKWTRSSTVFCSWGLSAQDFISPPTTHASECRHLQQPVSPLPLDTLCSFEPQDLGSSWFPSWSVSLQSALQMPFILQVLFPSDILCEASPPTISARFGCSPLPFSMACVTRLRPH